MDMHQWLQDEVKECIKKVEHRDIPEGVERYLKTDYPFNYELNELVYERAEDTYSGERYTGSAIVKVFNKEDGFLIECRGSTSDGKSHSVEAHVKHVDAENKGMAFDYAKQVANRQLYDMSSATRAFNLVLAEDAEALVRHVYEGNIGYGAENALVDRLEGKIMEKIKSLVEGLTCEIYFIECVIRDQLRSVRNEMKKDRENRAAIV